MSVRLLSLPRPEQGFFTLSRDIPFFLSSSQLGDMGHSGLPHPPQRIASVNTLLESRGYRALTATDLYAVSQVHGRHILRADTTPAMDVSLEADGILCEGDRQGALVTVADCLPIALWARGGEVRALLHSGWKGTGIIADALDMMMRLYGIRPGEVHMCIGPGIAADAYEVDHQRARIFRDRFGDAAVPGAGHLDLRAANVALARRCGLHDITVYRDCTTRHPGLSSYRAEGPDHYRRMAALLLPPPSIQVE